MPSYLDATILVMDAMHRARMNTQVSRVHEPDCQTGVLIVGDMSRSTSILHRIADRLDQRVDILGSDRTNLNDLTIWGSPLYEKLRFAQDSEYDYLTALRGWNDEMVYDDRIGHFRRMAGAAGLAIILSEDCMTAPSRFRTCDIRKV